MTVPDHPIRFVAEAVELLDLCWRMGWNEASGGNFSWRLPTDEIRAQLARADAGHNQTPGPETPLPAPHPALDGEFFLITGAGQCFRRARTRTDEVLGIVEVVAGGTAWRHHWGFASGARPTSEFATHLAGHAVRKRVSDGRERVILHAHPPEFVVLSFLEPCDSRTLSRALWQKMPECIVLFPDGIRVVPPLLPGTVEIAEHTAREMETGRVVSWSHHGIFVSEATPDAAFGLIETIEKAAMIHRRILAAGGPKTAIPTEILRGLAGIGAPHMVAGPEWLDDD